MRGDWVESAHARASRSAAYRKSLDAASDRLRTLCQTCHLPSFAFGQPDESPSLPSEGVSCDGCHTLSAVKVGATQASMSFDPGSGKKYGPILGASGHYFHDMAYSVLHTRSDLCAGCHHLTAYEVGGQTRSIPVVTDYTDWLRYGRGKTCQDCHMPSRGTEPVARGSRPRPNVPGHTFPGAAALGKLLRLEISSKGRGGEVVAEFSHNAGHQLPSGYVDRRLLVRAEFFGAGGEKLATEERSYGIFLVDDSDKPAPFFRAARVKEDRRLVPGRPYRESFRIPSSGTGGPGAAPTRVQISLIGAATAPELSAVYGQPELSVLKSASHVLPVRPGGKL